MKKVLSTQIAVLLLLGVFLSACGGGEEDRQTTTTTTTTTSTTTTTTTLPGFEGGTFDFYIGDVGQQPAGCLFSEVQMFSLMYLLNFVYIWVDLPPEDEYPALISFPFPAPFGTIEVTANFVEGQIVCDPTMLAGIDFGPFGLDWLDLNCLVGGTASGETTVLTQSEARLVVNISDMSATPGSGTGTCSLNPLEGCILKIYLEGGKACSDIDGDGYGNPGNSRCQNPEEDCEDSNPAVNPGVSEGPDGDPRCSDTIDNDCDSMIDLDDPGCVPCVDTDGDGYGNPASINCTLHQLDCNDSNPAVHPSGEGPEGNPTCSDGLDNDCDSLIDMDDPSCKSLVAFYPFNGNANDESGYGHHGSLNGAILSEDRFGSPNAAYLFDGLDDYILVTSAPDLEMRDQICITAWINCSGGEYNPRIVDHDADYHGYLLATVGTSNDRQISFWFGDRDISSGAGNTVRCGEWHFVAATATPSEQKIYIDGKLVNTGPGYTVAPVYITDLFIGSKPTNYGYDPWGGLLDDIHIYNRALAEADIQALYNAQ